MNSRIKLISTDFDGTLFAEFESPPIPRELQALIAELQGSGAKWAINTGRDMSSLMEALGRTGIGIQPDYLVLVEREIHLHQNSQYLSLEQWNDACHRDHAALFEQVRPELKKLIDWINSRYKALIYEDPFSPLCIIANDNGDMDVIHAYLEAFCRTFPGLSVVRNDVYARFCHVRYNKGTALAELTQRLGLTPREVFAAGDHLNDLPMLSKTYAHMIAAPANAVPAVKAAVLAQGGFISSRPHGEGVADAIKYYAAGDLGGG